MDEKMELKARSPMWNNPLAKGLFVGSKRNGLVYMPSAYTEKKMYPFRPYQIRFLHAFASGEPIEDICQKLNLEPKQALNILRKKKCKEYLAELESMDAEVLARSAKQRVAFEILEVWDGKKEKSREQMEAGKEWWARVWPRPEKNSGGSADKLEINISIGNIEEAKARTAVIEAEILDRSA